MYWAGAEFLFLVDRSTWAVLLFLSCCAPSPPPVGLSYLVKACVCTYIARDGKDCALSRLNRVVDLQLQISKQRQAGMERVSAAGLAADGLGPRDV